MTIKKEISNVLKAGKNLLFVGEMRSIDVVTGGFNFQIVSTGGFIAAKQLLKIKTFQ